jgi:hypothetical protein
MKHLVAIPFYCEDEIRRYLWIADLLKSFRSNTQRRVEFEFLLSPAPSIALNDTLFDALAQISTVRVYQCKTQTVGYPQRATAMFWEIMEHIGLTHSQDGGFVLWLESDMVPIRPDWLDKLTREWTSSTNLILMGPVIPEFRTRKGEIIPEHINGGACYAKDLASYVPLEARRRYFDLELFSCVKATKRFKASNLFVLASHDEIPDLILSSEAVILHGYLQVKDKFVRRCIDIVKSRKRYNMPGVMRFFRPVRCCKHGYWNRVSFFCPIHDRKRIPAAL